MAQPASRTPEAWTDTLKVGDRSYRYASLVKAAGERLNSLPYCLRVLLENVLRHASSTEDSAVAHILAQGGGAQGELDFRPARVVLQDFTGVPAVVDLAAMREAVIDLGGDPASINPLQQSDLVIDHSVQVDSFGLLRSLEDNVAREFERNRERYTFLKWGQSAFENMRVVPPNTGIVHQVNLEYLAQLVLEKSYGEDTWLVPDTLVGTDSHTTMINGLGVLGWGVGGIEAEAAMLGQAIQMLVPRVVGFELSGELPQGATATDLVLTVTEQLRAHGVVGAFVEFFGEGVHKLSLPDRATLANMAPEYGATMGFFPADEETLSYMRLTGRDEALISRCEHYLKAQQLFNDPSAPAPHYGERLSLDMGSITPSIAGPKRPQDRIAVSGAKAAWQRHIQDISNPEASATVALGERGQDTLTHGDVVIAAITSCTNTSNPSVMLAAGLLAKRAVERGLSVRPAVKTSLAPGSQVVTDYLKVSGLMPALETLGFHLVGYGCTTCIGNSGPLHTSIAEAAQSQDLVLASVLSGNRNFEGRVNPVTRANYLASPPLVVAYALAGTINIDFESEAIGQDQDGKPVYLRELWPSLDDVRAILKEAVRREDFVKRYADAQAGPAQWQAISTPSSSTYDWEASSTYIRKPPFFEGMGAESSPLPARIEGARVLARLGDSITTDHISPAGAIASDGPAAAYLREQGVSPRDFNSFGSRRGNHEVMMRGTFANIRLRNQLAPGTEGGYTRHLPTGDVTSIYDAAMRYAEAKTPLIVLAGKEYGTGSSRDWAAKGTQLLGIRAVLAVSYERIHRSNLIGMGVLPLQFLKGDSAESLGLSGEELFNFEGLDALKPGARVQVQAGEKRFEMLARVDTPIELEYLEHGGILHYVLRSLAKQSA